MACVACVSAESKQLSQPSQDDVLVPAKWMKNLCRHTARQPPVVVAHVKHTKPSARITVVIIIIICDWLSDNTVSVKLNAIGEFVAAFFFVFSFSHTALIVVLQKLALLTSTGRTIAFLLCACSACRTTHHTAGGFGVFSLTLPASVFPLFICFAFHCSMA